MLEKLQKLKNHQGFRRYFSNTSWLFGEKILRMFVGLFVGVWVARYLGPEQFGLLSYLFAFTALFGFLVRLGFDGGLVVKELKAQSDNGKVMATTFFLKFLGAILAVLSISIVIRFVESDPFTIVLMSLIGLTYFFRAFSVFDLYFQSLVLSKYTVIANAIALFSIAGVKVILILLKAPLIAFVYGALAESAIAAFIYLYFYMRLSRSGGKWKVDLTYAKELLARSWPIMISAFLISIYMQIDMIMIKNILGDSAAGYYAAATKISSLFYFIPVAISSSFFPAILNAKKRSQKLYYDRIGYLFDFSVLLMLPAALIITLFAEDIIVLLYGDQYLPAIAVVFIHIWAAVFVFFNNIQWKWYITEGLQKIALIRISIATVINIVLNFLLIPHYGISGAAISTLVSFAFAGYFGNAFFGKTVKLFVLQTSSLLIVPALVKLVRVLNK